LECDVRLERVRMSAATLLSSCRPFVKKGGCGSMLRQFLQFVA